MIVDWKTVPNEHRVQVIKLLNTLSNDIRKSREIEASIHSHARTIEDYIDKSQQLIFNVKQNPSLLQYEKNIVFKSDLEMAKGTIIEDIERETENRQLRFQQMLQEKYNMLNDKSFKATLKCRRCGSAEVSWEQKQTRSADEASTVFCNCNRCKNRWTMR